MFYLTRGATLLRSLESESKPLPPESAPRDPSVHGALATKPGLYAPSGLNFPHVSGHAAVVRGKQIIVLGGEAGPVVDTCPVIVFDSEREAWMRPHCIGIGPKWSPAGASATLVGSRVWLIGGKPDEADGPISVYGLDVSCQDVYLWRRVQTFGEIPSARHRHAACRVGEHEIWIVGGVPLSAGVFGGENAHADIFRLDTRTRVWMRVCTTGEKLKGVSDLMAARVGGTIALFGGRLDGASVSLVRTIQTEHPHEIATVPVTGAEPERRSFHAGAVVGGVLVIAGGRNGSTGLLPDAARLNLSTRVWATVPLSSEERRLLCRSSHTASAVGPTVWLIGGEGLIPSASHEGTCNVVALHTGLEAECERPEDGAEGDEADLWRGLVPVFNRDPEMAIEELIEARRERRRAARGPSPPTPPKDREQAAAGEAACAARFLRHAAGLDRDRVGEYLSGRAGERAAALRAFVALVDFRDVPFEFALRYLFSLFRPPGEAQLLARVVDAFADKYFGDNPQSKIFSSAASVSSLAYSVLMLNTSRHNPSVRPADRLNHRTFVTAVRDPRIPGGMHFPDAFLEALYYSIKRDPIRLPAQAGSGSRRPSRPSTPAPGSARASPGPSSRSGSPPLTCESVAWSFSDRTRYQQQPGDDLALLGAAGRRLVGVGGPAGGGPATPARPAEQPSAAAAAAAQRPPPMVPDAEPLMGPVSREGPGPRFATFPRSRGPGPSPPGESFRATRTPPVAASPPHGASPPSSRSPSPSPRAAPLHPTIRLLDPEVPTAAVLRPLAARFRAAADAAANAARDLAATIPPDDVLNAADKLRDAMHDPRQAQGRGAELAAAAYRVAAHAGRVQGPVPPGSLAAEGYQSWRVNVYGDLEGAVERLEGAAKALEEALRHAQAAGGGTPELARLAAAAAAAVPTWGAPPSLL